MAARLSLFLPRFVVLTLIALLTTATLTFAAENRMVTTPVAKPIAAAVPAQEVLVVPDVRNLVYVFAKGTLEQGGFAWKVTGPVAGYSANRVAGQSPAPGTRVLDTGAPRVSLTLRLNPGRGRLPVPRHRHRARRSSGEADGDPEDEDRGSQTQGGAEEEGSEAEAGSRPEAKGP